jgi:hypothetical protein
MHSPWDRISNIGWLVVGIAYDTSAKECLTPAHRFVNHKGQTRRAPTSNPLQTPHL